MEMNGNLILWEIQTDFNEAFFNNDVSKQELA